MKVGAKTQRRTRMETEEVMKLNLQKYAITAVFTLTCFTVPVRAATPLDQPSTGPRDDDGVSRVEAVVPDWSKADLAEQVRNLQSQFKLQQKELLARYQELAKAAKDASKEERDKLRIELKDQLKLKLEELIARQKELRATIRERFEQHQELIDAAKENAKEKIRQRRGNGGE